MKNHLAKLVFLTPFTIALASDHGSSWTYEGATGPEHWAELTEHNECSGHSQSPIDIDHLTNAAHAPLHLHYDAEGTEVLNNGHTIQVNYKPGSSVEIDGHVYELKQFHFHSTSEHTVHGKSYPLEAHFVHTDDHGKITVIGLLFEEGEENHALDEILSHMPHDANHTTKLDHHVSAQSILGDHLDYFSYQGSLTTPPCSEGVNWVLLKEPSHVSSHQVHQLMDVLGHHNNRPVQPLNGRTIIQ